jgi:tripartite ATP-independent transporter DctM subunit
MPLAVYFVGILFFLLLSVPVGAALYLLAVITDAADMQILQGMAGNIVWNTMNDYILVAVPLFVLLGEILTRSGLADRMYTSLAMWIRWLPGGLVHANIATCALFASASGSSVATAAAIGTVAQPTMLRLKYNEPMMLGSIAAGGTLGILIPPSMPMIIYGALTHTSVGKLFAAGIIPGLILAVTMSLIVIVSSLVLGHRTEDAKQRVALAQKIRSLLHLVPILLLFVIVMGTIYTGIATPTESAAFGLLATILLAAFNRTLSIKMLHEAFLATLRTTAMMLLILAGAFLLNFQLSVAGVPQGVAHWIGSFGLGKYETIWILVLFYLVLGCFLESLAMMVTTIGVVFPLVTGLGFDPVWFGVFMIVMMELSQITPPVGLNLFVVQNIRLNKSGSVKDIYYGVAPFVVAMMIFVAILIYFPDIALWLPARFF